MYNHIHFIVPDLRKNHRMNSAVLQYRIYLAILFFVFVIGMIGLITIEQFAPLDAVYFIIVTLATGRIR